MKRKLRLARFRDWSLDKKLICVYALCIIIPVYIVTLLGFQRYHDNLTTRVSEFGLNLTDQISTNLDNYILQLDRLSLAFYLDGVDGLTGKKDPMNVYNEKIAVDRALRNMMQIIPIHDVEGIYWVSDGEVQYSQYGSGKLVNHSGFIDEGWYDRVIAADGRGVIVPPYQPRYVVENSQSNPYIFSYARSIVKVANRNSYGVLLIDVSMDYIHKLLSETKIKTSSTLFIVDESGTIVYHPQTEHISEPFSLPLEGKFGKFTADIEGEPTMVQFVRSPQTGWIVLNTISVRQLSDELSILRNLLWIFTGAVLLLSIIFSSVLTMSIIKPLKGMKRLMRRVEMGDYEVRFHTQAKDEVGQLGNSFNHMVETINELVNRVLTMKIYQQQADFKLLQSQINPHFLFNTLESINMKAEINKDYEVAEMVSLLGKLFRLSLQQSIDSIPLSRELEYVQVYMKLQHIRFPKMIYSIEIAAELLLCRTLPWIIQPLVENAIVHAIAPARGNGSIHIAGERLGDDLLISIRNDGISISTERLTEVEQLLSAGSREDGEEHIGLYNVHKRITGFYGEQYGLSIQQLPTSGTLVQLTIRYCTDKGGSDHAENDDC
ncbi:MAG: sensor histidine kinase [Candidatus Pristimantibacillus sp.]